jgi:hypothetical protein
MDISGSGGDPAWIRTSDPQLRRLLIIADAIAYDYIL